MPKYTLGAGLSLVLVTAALLPQASLAAMDEPSPPKVDCTSPVNKDNPACNPQNGALSDDQIYQSAYWSAKNGDYQGALATAARAKNQDDPRILRVKGFATRKLGDVDAAMPFYQKALALDPDDTKTREYMGEALLSLGDMAAAREQLREIESRCGVSCDDYQALADAIAGTHAKLRTLGIL
jgi:tetratricopeptide (TPR) repeat protein